MPHAVSPLYLLERFDVGVVELNEQRHVVAMNAFARRVLPVQEKQPFDRMVLSFHPERSKPKVEFLLDQAEGSSGCPVPNPPPMTMIINIPERVLLIKVTRMTGATGQGTGLRARVLRHHRRRECAGRRVGGARSAAPAAEDPHRGRADDRLRRHRRSAVHQL